MKIFSKESLGNTKTLVYASVFVVLGVLIPYTVSHAFGIRGTIILPMHIPVLLCGFICGPVYGLACGILSPLLSSVLTGMPAMYPMLPIMMLELSFYGAVSGFLYKKFKLPVYAVLPAALTIGRAGYGIMFAVLNAFDSNLSAPVVWAAVTTGLPGIAIQLVLIPILINVLEKNNFDLLFYKRLRAINAAKTKISRNDAKYIIIKNGKIVCERSENGIKGPLEILANQKELMQNASVVDKIVGKAAAAVFILGGAKYVYGFVMSCPARDFLIRHGVRAEYGTLTDVIQNRTGDGICPIEQSVYNIGDPKEALKAINNKLEDLKNVK